MFNVSISYSFVKGRTPFITLFFFNPCDPIFVRRNWVREDGSLEMTAERERRSERAYSALYAREPAMGEKKKTLILSRYVCRRGLWEALLT